MQEPKRVKKLGGVFPPLVTPFIAGDTVDEAGLRATVRFLKPHIHDLFVCGTYGGGPLIERYPGFEGGVLEIARSDAIDRLGPVMAVEIFGRYQVGSSEVGRPPERVS